MEQFQDKDIAGKEIHVMAARAKRRAKQALAQGKNVFAPGKLSAGQVNQMQADPELAVSLAEPKKAK